MSNRVFIQEGYSLPFEGHRRRKHRRGRRKHLSGAMKRQQSKMKDCARKWHKSGTGKYSSFMARCLKGR